MAGIATLGVALTFATVPPAQAAGSATQSTSAGTVVPAVEELVSDTFDRTVPGGWGSTPGGDPWTTGSSRATYAVARGAGSHTVPAYVTSATRLPAVETADSDTRVDVAFDRPTGSGPAAYASVVGRSVAGAGDYRARLVVTWSGRLQLVLSQGATALRTVPLDHLGYAPGKQYTVRLQITGAAPTTVRAKAWVAGTAEPSAWSAAATDSTASLQESGRFELSTYVSGGSKPVTVSYSDLRVTRPLPPNAVPTASFGLAGDDQTVRLDGSTSWDLDGTIRSYVWQLGDGRTVTGETAVHTFDAPGDYPVTLTVTDDRGATSSTTRTVTAVAPNQLPTATFTPATTDLTVTLDATASTDPDGTLDTLTWDLGDGTRLTGPTVTHTYAAPGTYPVTLTVTDDRRGTTTTTRTVTAVAPNQLPTATFTPATTDLTVTLDATASTDPDGTLDTLTWDLGDGTRLTGPTVAHTYAAPGTYPVTLTVTDDRRGTTTTTRTVTAVAPNQLPTATFTPATTDLTVTLDATASTDPDGTLDTYTWDLGDGTRLTGPTVAHTYTTAGTYPVTLTVTDSGAATAVASRDVTALAPVVTPLTGERLAQLGWKGKQEAAEGRITAVSGTAVPGAGALRADSALRVEIRAGDMTTTGSYVAPRSEVHGRHPSPWSTAAQDWPDPVGSERWYRIRFFVPEDFPTATDTRWLTLTQWKGLNGGSPPIALEIKRDNLRLGGTRTNAGAIPNDGLLGKLAKGRWTEVVVGMQLSTSAADGWVEVSRDGTTVLPRTSVSTMDVLGGKVDPIYLKQGIYRSTAWAVDQVVYFAPVEVSATRLAPTPR